MVDRAREKQEQQQQENKQQAKEEEAGTAVTDEGLQVGGAAESSSLHKWLEGATIGSRGGYQGGYQGRDQQRRLVVEQAAGPRRTWDAYRPPVQGSYVRRQHHQ